MLLQRQRKVAFGPELTQALNLLCALHRENLTDVFRCTRFCENKKAYVPPEVRKKHADVVGCLRRIDPEHMHELVPFGAADCPSLSTSPGLVQDEMPASVGVPELPPPFHIEAISFMGAVHQIRTPMSEVLYEACPIDLSRPAALVRVGDTRAVLSTIALTVLRGEVHTTWHRLSATKPDLAARPDWDATADLGDAVMLLDKAGMALEQKHLQALRQALVHTSQVQPAFIERFAESVPPGHNRFVAGLIALEESAMLEASGSLWPLAISARDHITPAQGQTSLLHYYAEFTHRDNPEGCLQLIAAGHPVQCLDARGRTPLDIAETMGCPEITNALRVAIACEHARDALSQAAPSGMHP